jgi:hypothetical protein
MRTPRCKRELASIGRGSAAFGREAAASMAKYEFKIVFLDRLELRTGGAALAELNALGGEGWHIVHLKDDPHRERDFAIILERQIE